MVKAKELKVMRKKIDKADKLVNPLTAMQTVPSDLPFTVPAAPDAKDDNKAFNLQALPSTDLTQENIQALLNIFEDNMGEMYRISTWGLNLEEKAEEFRHRKARFLLVWSKGGEEAPPKIAAFVHFRFCTEYVVHACERGYVRGIFLVTVSHVYSFILSVFHQ